MTITTKTQESFDKLTKEQVLHLIIWQMFKKQISLEDLAATIKERELEIVNAVNKHLNEEFIGCERE